MSYKEKHKVFHFALCDLMGIPWLCSQSQVDTWGTAVFVLLHWLCSIHLDHTSGQEQIFKLQSNCNKFSIAHSIKTISNHIYDKLWKNIRPLHQWANLWQILPKTKSWGGLEVIARNHVANFATKAISEPVSYCLMTMYYLVFIKCDSALFYAMIFVVWDSRTELRNKFLIKMHDRLAQTQLKTLIWQYVWISRDA